MSINYLLEIMAVGASYTHTLLEELLPLRQVLFAHHLLTLQPLECHILVGYVAGSAINQSPFQSFEA